MPKTHQPAGLPTSKQILEFIEQSGQPAGKREIARAFSLSGHEKIMLKALLKDMADEGLIDSASLRRPSPYRRLCSSRSLQPSIRLDTGIGAP